MAKVVIEGFSSLEVAKMFCDWYEGQGEQDAHMWFDCNCLPPPMTNMRHPEGFCTVDEDTETVTMRVK